MTKVILCDDHALIRRGIRDTLSDAADIEVVGEAGDYPELRNVGRVSFLERLGCVKLGLWCEASRRLISFSELRSRMARA